MISQPPQSKVQGRPWVTTLQFFGILALIGGLSLTSTILSNLVAGTSKNVTVESDRHTDPLPQDGLNIITLPCTNRIAQEEIENIVAQNEVYLSNFTVLGVAYESRPQEVGTAFLEGKDRILRTCGTRALLTKKEKYPSYETMDYSKTLRGKILTGWDVEQVFKDGANVRLQGLMTSEDLTSMIRRHHDIVQFLVTDGEIGPYVQIVSDDSSYQELQCPCYENITLFLSDDIDVSAFARSSAEISN